MDFVAVAAFYLFIYIFAHGVVSFLRYFSLFLRYFYFIGYGAGARHKLHVPSLSIAILRLCRNYDLGFGYRTQPAFSAVRGANALSVRPCTDIAVF